MSDEQTPSLPENTDAPVGGEEAPLAPKEFLVGGNAEELSAEILAGDLVPGQETSPADNPEGTDPSVSVEDLLSAEAVPEAGVAIAASVVDAPPPPQQPTFQMLLPSLSEDGRKVMKKALDAQGIQVPEQSWTAASPMITQLTEYQAILLLQSARALGVSVQLSVLRPLPLPSEEDLALGDLSAVAEPIPTAIETAPSVSLPKGEKEVLLCTPDHLPGNAVLETLGIVLAHRSIARRLFREDDLKEKLEKELRLVPNRPSTSLPASHLQAVLRDLFLDLRKGALTRGGNSVLGLKIEAFPESSSTDPQLEQLRLVAFGTAAVVEKS